MFALITLADLELGAALLSDPGAGMRFKHPARWQEFGRRVADAMRSRTPIHVVTAAADAMPTDRQWRVPLPEAPEPWRTLVMNALRAIAGRHCDCTFDPVNVQFVF
jgi:hypothetical protein